MAPRVVRGLLRLAVAAAVVLAVVSVLSVLLGLLGHVPVRRAVSVGMYGVGALMMTLGVLHGVRPPVRVDGDRSQMGAFGVLFPLGRVRAATPDEHRDTRSSAALFVGLGMMLVVIGALIDPSHRLL